MGQFGTRDVLAGIISDDLMTEEDEIRVIQRVLDGDVDAFSVLVETYQNSLIRMLATLLNDHRRFAEDVAQEVMVEAFRRLGSFDPARSKFSTWLFMIARSRGINALKRKRPQLFAEAPETAAEVKEDRREDLAILDRAVSELPPKQKRAFVLVVVEGLSHEDAARVETVAPGTIKSRVSRAREFLKAALEAAMK